MDLIFAFAQFSVILSQFLHITFATTIPYANCTQGRTSSTYLWRVSRSRDSTALAYLYGTIHVPYTQVWPYVDENVKRAFDTASTIYFELDLADSKTMRKLAACQLLPSDEELSDHLTPELYSRLNEHMSYLRESLPNWTTRRSRRRDGDSTFASVMGNWHRRRPIWLLLQLNSLSAESLSTRRTPVLDLHLARRAHALRKTTGAVEEAHEQCSPLNQLNHTQVEFALDQLLMNAEMERSEHRRRRANDESVSTADLVAHYNCGTLDANVFAKDTSVKLARQSNADSSRKAANIDAYFRRELIDKRNARMTRRIMLLLSQQTTVAHRSALMFALGAGHFLGDGSVVDRLRSAGYTVRMVERGEHIADLVDRSSVHTPQFGPPPSTDRLPGHHQHTPVIKDLWVRPAVNEKIDWYTVRRQERHSAARSMVKETKLFQRLPRRDRLSYDYVIHRSSATMTSFCCSLSLVFIIAQLFV